MPLTGVMEALTDNEGTKIKARGGSKVKLFLCSRDIDWTKCATLETHVPFKQKDENDLPFQVIGEISPEATWVKEGDEFDESEVGKLVETELYYADAEEQFQKYGGFIGVEETYIPRGKQTPTHYETIVNEIIQIKDPCGHYH